MTRLMYLFIIIVGILLSSVFLVPSVKEALAKKPDTNVSLYNIKSL